MYVIKITDSFGAEWGMVVREGEKFLVSRDFQHPARLDYATANQVKKTFERNPNCDHLWFDLMRV